MTREGSWCEYPARLQRRNLNKATRLSKHHTYVVLHARTSPHTRKQHARRRANRTHVHQSLRIQQASSISVPSIMADAVVHISADEGQFSFTGNLITPDQEDCCCSCWVPLVDWMIAMCVVFQSRQCEYTNNEIIIYGWLWVLFVQCLSFNGTTLFFFFFFAIVGTFNLR